MSVRINGKNRLRDLMLSLFFFPLHTCKKFETKMGTIIKAIAVGKSKTETKAGTAKRGSPIPRVPLTVPAKNKTVRQVTKTKGERLRKSKLFFFLMRH